jgi:hypothetical protein
MRIKMNFCHCIPVHERYSNLPSNSALLLKVLWVSVFFIIITVNKNFILVILFFTIGVTFHFWIF